MLDEEENLSTVARFDSPNLAQIVKLRFESEGIPVVIQGRAPSPFTAGHTAPWGGLHLKVRESDRIRAEEILREAAAGALDEGTAPACPKCGSKEATLRRRPIRVGTLLVRLLKVCGRDSGPPANAYEYTCRHCGYAWNDGEEQK